MKLRYHFLIKCDVMSNSKYKILLFIFCLMLIENDDQFIIETEYFYRLYTKENFQKVRRKKRELK